LTGPALVALIVTVLFVTANENVFIVYGAWLEERFHLSVSSIGFASAVIAVAEVFAETGSAGFLDRLGKRRGLLITISSLSVTYLILPRVAGTLGGFLAGLFLLMFIFEFCAIALMALVSELAPAARGSMLSLMVASIAVGRVTGSLTGPLLWERGGMAVNAAFSACLVLLATVLVWLGVRERS